MSLRTRIICVIKKIESKSFAPEIFIWRRRRQVAWKLIFRLRQKIWTRRWYTTYFGTTKCWMPKCFFGTMKVSLALNKYYAKFCPNISCSNRWWLNRRDYERSSKIYKMVLFNLRLMHRYLVINTLSLYAYNKIDSVSIEFLDQLAREPHTVVMSCELDLGIQDVVDTCWKELRLIRVYTKR